MMARSFIAMGMLVGLLEASAGAAPRGRGAPALPAAEVISNLQSPTGRAAFFLLQTADKDAAADRCARAARLAETVQAKVDCREGGGVIVVLLQHEEKRLALRRLGRDLRVELAEPWPLPPKMQALMRLSGPRTDTDYDKELLLRASDRLREAEKAPAELLSLAQGGAARGLLYRFVQGDDVGATLFGQRHAALIMAHPDTRLLQPLIRAADEKLTVPLPEGPPKLAPLKKGALAFGPPPPALLVALARSARAEGAVQKKAEVH